MDVIHFFLCFPKIDICCMHKLFSGSCNIYRFLKNVYLGKCFDHKKYLYEKNQSFHIPSHMYHSLKNFNKLPDIKRFKYLLNLSTLTIQIWGLKLISVCECLYNLKLTKGDFYLCTVCMFHVVQTLGKKTQYYSSNMVYNTIYFPRPYQYLYTMTSS